MNKGKLIHFLFRKTLPPLIFLWGIITATPGVSLADGWDLVLDGFEEPAAASGNRLGPESLGPMSPSAVRFGGWARVGGTWNFAHSAPPEGETDWRGLSRLRPEVQINGDLRLPRSWRLYGAVQGFYDLAYVLRGRDGFTREVIDEYERELEVREAFVAGPLSGRLDLKAGRQIVVWGRSDHIRVTDVLNPLDLREPGLTDVEDLRLPVTMVRLDYHGGPWTLTALLIPEIRFDKRPVFGHDFFPSDRPLPPEEVPESGVRNVEYAAALTGIFPGWDISFYLADRYDDQPHAEAGQDGAILKHARTTMAGAASSIALGNVLLFGEAALTRGLKTFGAAGPFSRTDFLAGIEYAGFSDTLISFETAYGRLNGYRPVLSFDHPDRERIQTVLRISRTFQRERLTLTAVAFTGAKGEDGALQRVQATYDLRDGVALTAGVVLFQSGGSPHFRGTGDNDRAFAEVKWSF